ncbi:MAG: response regulator, partial [Desulfobacteraceae bacterium]|jgi:twitching motility two-component system response regulator PilG
LNKYETVSTKGTRDFIKGTFAEDAFKKKILVVDDSPTTRKVVVLTLLQKGYKIFEAQDGLEALSKIDSERPDLILLDVVLPKMDGYKILSIVKDNKELKQIPVIMLTSKDGLINKVKGKLAGSAAYLTKPFDPKELIETVRKFI